MPLANDAAPTYAHRRQHASEMDSCGNILSSDEAVAYLHIAFGLRSEEVPAAPLLSKRANLGKSVLVSFRHEAF